MVNLIPPGPWRRRRAAWSRCMARVAFLSPVR